ncbi:hypothetical protein PAAG_03224 [Paracoccidioides lutzii Pb01]|uniref:BZIP domain-containing protein n=1 Tax=Paracoccidioides lutzii (strain ATCC MYA-826 / Pb01) TaxID=502779 RepID=C1GYS0_PARBA|nr:hypothetical protein PAAG_03224 [Paracoccidioides lutzii Pb01]EEH41661.2 hypothetical protein PAAG_03224 [Paracoccidioides lutzii Pb01]
MSKRPYASDFPSGSPSPPIRKTIVTTEPHLWNRNNQSLRALEPQQARETSAAVVAKRTITPDQLWRTPITRSMGINAILNPSHSLAMDPSPPLGIRDLLEPALYSSSSPSTNPPATPSPMGLTPSSDPFMSQHGRRMYSPVPQRHILTAKSPAVRSQNIGFGYPPVRGTMLVEQTPFVPQPYGDSLVRSSMDASQSTRHFMSKLSNRPTTFPGNSRPVVAPQNTTLDMAQTAYRPLLQASHPPSPTNLLQQPISSLPQHIGDPFTGEESWGRTPQNSDSSYTFVSAHSRFSSIRDPSSQSIIPIDFDSGSREAAEKRLKNCAASRSFRKRRKLNENEMKHKLERQEDKIRHITEARDFYRAERDFFKALYGRDMGLDRIPRRPQSPVPESEGEQEVGQVRRQLDCRYRQFPSKVKPIPNEDNSLSCVDLPSDSSTYAKSVSVDMCSSRDLPTTSIFSKKTARQELESWPVGIQFTAECIRFVKISGDRFPIVHYYVAAF